MLRQKNQLIFLLVGAILCLTEAIHAQQQNELSRWTVGAEITTVINAGEDTLRQRLDDRITYGRLGTNVGYRLHKLISLNGQVQYHRRSITDQVLDRNSPRVGSFTYHHHQATNMFSVSVGPELMLRIAQGDLRVFLNYGLAANFSKVRAVRHDGPVFNIKYKPAIISLLQYGIGYTHWSTQRIGVSASVSVQQTAMDNPSFGRLVPQTIDSNLGPAEAAAADLEEVHPSLLRYPRLNAMFSLGIHYRFAH